jgi:hypothetical protein
MVKPDHQDRLPDAQREMPGSAAARRWAAAMQARCQGSLAQTVAVELQDKLLLAAVATGAFHVGLGIFSKFYFSSTIISHSRTYGTIGAIFVKPDLAYRHRGRDHPRSGDRCRLGLKEQTVRAR